MRNKKPFDLIGRIKGSVKNWLLPHPFKIVGQVMLLLVLVALVASIFFTQNSMASGDVTIDSLSISVWQRAISIVLYLAILLVTCSREKNEDEMTAQLRGETLKEVCYVAMFFYIAIKIVATICAEEMPYIMHDETNYFASIIWMLYYGRFEHKMKSLRRQSRQFNL